VTEKLNENLLRSRFWSTPKWF